jgi:hypothetical protein
MSTFNALNLTTPDPTAQAMAGFAQSVRDNLKVAYAAACQGTLANFAYSQSGGTAQYPTTQLWSWDAMYRLRRTITWGTGTPAGTLNNITAATLEWSDDGGTSWATVASETRTYDSNGNLTATTNAGSALAYAEALYGRVSLLSSTLTAHQAVTTGAHGTGTLALQNANAAAITGGTIDGTAIGGTTPAAVSATTFTGKGINLGATITGSVNVDWSAGDYFYGTFTGAGAVLAFVNLPAADKARGITIEITNAGLATNPWPAGLKWPGGALPARTSGASAVDIYEFSCRDGTTVRAVQAEKDTK